MTIMHDICKSCIKNDVCRHTEEFLLAANNISDVTWSSGYTGGVQILKSNTLIDVDIKCRKFRSKAATPRKAATV